ncbi:hypothetical protein [Chryseobacterium sp. Marseille-Q3244]|uniref:hypothetical protein n=1 Tax=Chryseobacterium sp. Marseille-Q3244 TaxID=2758092 RepID=UPI0020258A0D|nr:hypothetical protein [Chryseobacterium sp. Marseille-Q3244]
MYSLYFFGGGGVCPVSPPVSSIDPLDSDAELCDIINELFGTTAWVVLLGNAKPNSIKIN